MTEASQKDLWQIYIAAAQKKLITSDPKEVEKNLREAIAGLEQSCDSRLGLIADANFALGNICRDQGRFEEAENLYDSALFCLRDAKGPDTLATITVLDRKADLYCELGDFKKAKSKKQESLEMLVKFEGPKSLNVATAQSELANFSMILREYNEAARLYEMSLFVIESSESKNDVYIENAHAQLATVDYMLSRFEQSETHIRRAIELNRASGAGCDKRYRSHLNLLGLTLCAQGKQSEAQPLCKQALAIGEPESSQSESADCLSQLADVYCEQERFDDAASLCKEAFWQREKALGSPKPDLVSDLKAYSFLLQQIGRMDEAERIEKRARSLALEVA